MPALTTYTVTFTVSGISSETIRIKYKANDETTYTILATLPNVPPGIPQSYTLPPLETHRVYTVILETVCGPDSYEFGGIRYLTNFICSPFTAEFIGSTISVDWECYVPESSGDSVKEYRIEYRPLGSTSPYYVETIPIATIVADWAATPGSYPFYNYVVSTGVNPAIAFEVNHYTVIEYNFYTPGGGSIPIEVVINSSSPCSVVLDGQECPNCGEALDFVSNPGVDGTYVDDESPILVERTGGNFGYYFEIAGTGSASGTTGGDPNFRSSTYISNPSSDYYQMIAVNTFNYPSASKIQIWNPSPTPTPVLVAEFTYPSAGFGNSIFGPIAYDAVNDRIYFTILSLQMHYLDLATGTFTFVTNIGGSPSGNTNGYGMAINPVTNKKYTFASGVLLYPPDRGANQIFSPTGVLQNTFPFDSIYTTPDPTIDIEFAPTAGFIFDNAGYAYTVTSTQVTDYDPPFTQRDIVKLHPVTNEVVAILNYDLTQTWLPLSYTNSANQSAMQYYDGTGLISGEKILVAYRNIGPSTGQTPTGNAWTNFPGTVTRLVAFDITAPYASSVILELPDSTYGTITKFFYSYQFNKIFTNNTTNVLRAFDLAGNVVYSETTPTYNGANVYEWYDLPFCNRVFGMNAESNPNPNLILIEPVDPCPSGVVKMYIGPDGPYQWNSSTNSWDVMCSTVLTPGTGTFTVTASFLPSIVDAALLLSTDGGTTYLPYPDQSSVLYAAPGAWALGRVYTDPGVPYSVRVTFTDNTPCSLQGAIV